MIQDKIFRAVGQGIDAVTYIATLLSSVVKSSADSPVALLAGQKLVAYPAITVVPLAGLVGNIIDGLKNLVLDILREPTNWGQNLFVEPLLVMQNPYFMPRFQAVWMDVATVSVALLPIMVIGGLIAMPFAEEQKTSLWRQGLRLVGAIFFIAISQPAIGIAVQITNDVSITILDAQRFNAPETNTTWADKVVWLIPIFIGLFLKWAASFVLWFALIGRQYLLYFGYAMSPFLAVMWYADWGVFEHANEFANKYTRMIAYTILTGPLIAIALRVQNAILSASVLGVATCSGACNPVQLFSIFAANIILAVITPVVTAILVWKAISNAGKEIGLGKAMIAGAAVAGVLAKGALAVISGGISGAMGGSGALGRVKGAIGSARQGLAQGGSAATNAMGFGGGSGPGGAPSGSGSGGSGSSAGPQSQPAGQTSTSGGIIDDGDTPGEGLVGEDTGTDGTLAGGDVSGDADPGEKGKDYLRDIRNKASDKGTLGKLSQAFSKRASEKEAQAQFARRDMESIVDAIDEENETVNMHQLSEEGVIDENVDPTETTIPYDSSGQTMSYFTEDGIQQRNIGDLFDEKTDEFKDAQAAADSAGNRAEKLDQMNEAVGDAFSKANDIGSRVTEMGSRLKNSPEAKFLGSMTRAGAYGFASTETPILAYAISGNRGGSGGRAAGGADEQEGDVTTKRDIDPDQISANEAPVDTLSGQEIAENEDDLAESGLRFQMGSGQELELTPSERPLEEGEQQAFNATILDADGSTAYQSELSVRDGYRGEIDPSDAGPLSGVHLEQYEGENGEVQSRIVAGSRAREYEPNEMTVDEMYSDDLTDTTGEEAQLTNMRLRRGDFDGPEGYEGFIAENDAGKQVTTYVSDEQAEEIDGDGVYDLQGDVQAASADPSQRPDGVDPLTRSPAFRVKTEDEVGKGNDSPIERVGSTTYSTDSGNDERTNPQNTIEGAAVELSDPSNYGTFEGVEDIEDVDRATLTAGEDQYFKIRQAIVNEGDGNPVPSIEAHAASNQVSLMEEVEDGDDQVVTQFGAVQFDESDPAPRNQNGDVDTWDGEYDKIEGVHVHEYSEEARGGVLDLDNPTNDGSYVELNPREETVLHERGTLDE